MPPVHDYVIDNSTGANVRADINSVLQAILSNNSSSSAPSTTAAYMWWADTTNGILKIRNSANNAWVELLQLDGTLTLEDGSVSSPALAFRDDLNTGLYSSAADTFNVATGGVERMELGATTIFNEDGADVDFRIEGDTEANLFYVDAGNDRVGIGLSSPSTLFHVNLAAENGSIAQFGLSGQTNNQSFIIKADDSDSLFTFRFGSGTSTYPAVRFNMGADAEACRIDSSGKLSTGGETAPDVSAGGLCLNQGTGDEKILTFKSSDIAHGVTTFDETDTFFSARKSSGNKGGIRLHGLTDAAGADPAFEFHGIISSDSDASYVPFEFRGHEANGTGTQNIAADRRILKITNSDGTIISSFTGTGLTFGNDTAAANALDDYEEVSWTPIVAQGIDGGASYSIQRGFAVKIGAFVHFSFFIRFSGTGNGNHFKLGGLPFTTASSPYGASYNSAGSMGYSNVNFNNSNQQMLFIGNNSTNFEFYNGSPASNSSVSGANSNKDIYAAGNYRTAT